VRGAQHLEDPVEASLVHDVADADEVEVAGGDTHDEVLLGHDA